MSAAWLSRFTTAFPRATTGQVSSTPLDTEVEGKTAIEVDGFAKKLGASAVRNVEDELRSGMPNPSSTLFAAAALIMYFWLGLSAAEKIKVVKSLACKVKSIDLQRTGVCNQSLVVDH